MTTCSDGGLAASRLCSEGYEFDADPVGEAIDGDTLEDRAEGEETEVALELLAETRTKEHAASSAEKTIFRVILSVCVCLWRASIGSN